MADFTSTLKPAPQSDGVAALAKERSQSSVPVQDLANHLLSRDDFSTGRTGSSRFSNESLFLEDESNELVET
jgi:hypothetical protein